MIAKSLQALIFLMLTPLGLWGQAAESVPLGAQGPKPYGNGEKSALSYAGEFFVPNIILIDVNVGSNYNDNVSGNNLQRRGDIGFQLGPSIGFRRQGKQLTLSFDYRPNLLIYRRTPARDTLDHSLQFDVNYLFNRRLSFRGRGSFAYTRGIFQPGPSEEFMPELGSPARLNETVFQPPARQFERNLRFDASYQLSRRTVFALFMGAMARNFGRGAADSLSLNNTEKRNVGFLYLHRLSPHGTLGIDYILQVLHFGPNTRALVHTTLFSYARDLSRNVTLNVYAGPEPTRLNDVVPVEFLFSPFAVPITRAQWHWAVGGDLTKRTDKTAFQVSAQRQVSDGGGFLGPTVSSSVGMSVRRRLPGRWDAVWSTSFSRNIPLQGGRSTGIIQGQTVGFSLERSLAEHLSFRMGYDFLRQRTSIRSLSLANFDRNLVYGSLVYRAGRFTLGR